MIDPMEPIDLPGNPDLALQLRAQDALVEARLQRMKVLTHLNTVARGHKAWADLNPPTTQELVEYGEWLLANPNDLGNQYSAILKGEIDLRIKDMMARVPVMSSGGAYSDAYQDCY